MKILITIIMFEKCIKKKNREIIDLFTLAYLSIYSLVNNIL